MINIFKIFKNNDNNIIDNKNKVYEIEKELGFEYKILDNAVIIYKEFSANDLINYAYKVGGSLAKINDNLYEYGEKIAGNNRKVKNLLISALLKNLEEKINEIENDMIKDIEIKIYAENEREAIKIFNKYKINQNNLENQFQLN